MFNGVGVGPFLYGSELDVLPRYDLDLLLFLFLLFAAYEYP